MNSVSMSVVHNQYELQLLCQQVKDHELILQFVQFLLKINQPVTQ